MMTDDQRLEGERRVEVLAPKEGSPRYMPAMPEPYDGGLRLGMPPLDQEKVVAADPVVLTIQVAVGWLHTVGPT